MKTFMIYAIVALVLMGTAGCEKANVKLTSGDLTLAEETGFPELFLLRIKGAGRNMRQLEGVDAEGEPAKAKGVTIDVAQDKAPQTVRKLQEAVPPGYLVFISEMNFGISGKPDQVSVLKAASPYDALAVMGTKKWLELRPQPRHCHRARETVGQAFRADSPRRGFRLARG